MKIFVVDQIIYRVDECILQSILPSTLHTVTDDFAVPDAHVLHGSCRLGHVKAPADARPGMRGSDRVNQELCGDSRSRPLECRDRDSPGTPGDGSRGSGECSVVFSIILGTFSAAHSEVVGPFLSMILINYVPY